MRASIYIIFIGIILSFVSCESAFYSDSYSFKKSVWRYDDPRSFNFNITDTTKVYDMILTVDHTDQFPYQNLYVEALTTFPSDTSIKQLLSLEMANEAGFWLGECQGSNCQLSIPIQSNVHFQEKGSYTLNLEQYTRRDSLIGLKGIGLSINLVGE